MLRNLSKCYLFICCKQSSSTHFCHFLTTAFVADALMGSHPMKWARKRKGLHRWRPNNSVVGDEGCRVRLAPPAFASSLRSSRAALENASRFLSSAPCRVRIPCAGHKKERPPSLGAFSIKWWAMRDVACGWRRPLSLRRFAPRVLRWKTLARFLSSAPLRVRIPLRWAQTKTVPFRGPFPIQWWAMRDSNPQPCACKAPTLTVAPIARKD